MKRLRILTGIHAGVSVVLETGPARVGAHEQADIQISDWTEPELLLTVQEDGKVLLQRLPEPAEASTEADPDSDSDSDSDSDAEPDRNSRESSPKGADTSASADIAPRPMQDFAPERYGEVIICTGPDSGQWPPDVDLLQRLYAPARNGAAMARMRWRTPALLGVGALACGVAMVCALLLTSETGHAVTSSESVDPSMRLADRIRAELTRRGLTELRVSTQAGILQLHGYVPTLAEDAEVRELIRAFGPVPIERRYRVVRTDSQALRQIIGQDGVRVAYAGQGLFKLTGTVRSMAEYDKALARARTELGTQSARVESEVTEAAARIPALSYSNLFSTGDLQYARTPDGIKHVFPAASSTLPVHAENDATAPLVRVLSADIDIQPNLGAQTSDALTSSLAGPPADRARMSRASATDALHAGNAANAANATNAANTADAIDPAGAVPLRPPLPDDGTFVGLPSMSGRR